jgi:hypothetical protein
MYTPERIQQIFESGDLDQLLGMKEDLWFDAKQLPGYDFARPEGRIELAKDISGFANSEGGYLVIGLETTVSLEENTETVSAVRLFPKADFKPIQVRGLIKEHVHPELTGLEVFFAESKTLPDLGLGVIWVPPQDERRKYFLMVRVVEDGRELKQVVFGIARRNASSTEPLTFQDLYRLTQNGKSDGAQRLTRMEQKLDSLLHGLNKTATPAAAIDIDALIKKIMKS